MKHGKQGPENEDECLGIIFGYVKHKTEDAASTNKPLIIELWNRAFAPSKNGPGVIKGVTSSFEDL